MQQPFGKRKKFPLVIDALLTAGFHELADEGQDHCFHEILVMIDSGPAVSLVQKHLVADQKKRHRLATWLELLGPSFARVDIAEALLDEKKVLARRRFLFNGTVLWDL